MKALLGAIALTLSLAAPAAASALERPETWTLPAKVAGSTAVGRQPVDLAFAPSGEAWVANWGDGTVTRLAPDGRRLGTYPVAANTDGTTFRAKANTPTVNGLSTALLTNNPNGYNPARLTPAQALTCDQDHSDTPEQQAYDYGLADKFPQYTGVATCSAEASTSPSDSG